MEFWDEIIKSLSDSLFNKNLFDNFDKSITYNRISRNDELINYPEYINAYEKIGLTGTVTIETVDIDSVCSYYVINKSSNSEPEFFYNVPPYCIHRIFIDADQEIYVFKTGLVRIYHRKLDDCNNFIKNLLAFSALFIFPVIFLMFLYLLFKIIFNISFDDFFSEASTYILALLYYFGILPLVMSQQDRKKKKYNRLRKAYFEGIRKSK